MKRSEINAAIAHAEALLADYPLRAAALRRSWTPREDWAHAPG
jgi:hypothetical protein